MPPDLPRNLRFGRSALENRSVVILDQRLYLISLSVILISLSVIILILIGFKDDVTHRDVVSFQVISQCVAASLLF